MSSMKKKIAFTAFRYGEGIFGGTEIHCRMLAERLKPYYEVEVLTSTLRHPTVSEEDFPAGERLENGILVRRFRAEPDREHTNERRREASKARRLRYLLDQWRLLTPLAALHPLWTLNEEAERRFFATHEEYAPTLADFIREHKEEYAAILPVGFNFTSTLTAALEAPERCILIPTAHPVRSLYFSLFTRVFTRVRHIAFNTPAEQRLCRRVFGPALAPNSIVGCSIEKAAPVQWEEVKTRYELPDDYLLYVGRMHPQKIGSLIPDFLRYKQQYGGEIRLVLVGPADADSGKIDRSEIIVTGSVSDEEKLAIIRHATLMVNPSLVESLSLLLLEALDNGIPMLVNGRCEVMKDHCKFSGAALWYDNGRDFRKKLHRILSDPALRQSMAERGPRYVRENYGWELIIGKLRRLIENL